MSPIFDCRDEAQLLTGMRHARQAIYGDRTGALAQLEADGEVVAKTDASWQAGFGPLRSASIYDGTVTDLRLDDPAVHEPGFAADGWRAASTHPDLTMRDRATTAIRP